MTNILVPTAAAFDFDIYDDSRVQADVQASYARALDCAPDIFYTERNGGHWVARSYEAIEAIVKDTEHFSAREIQIPRVPNPPFFIPLSMDPPANLPYRLALMPRFSPKAIRELMPALRQWAMRIVGDVADAGECDFARDVASLYPVSIFMESMGLPLERLREFRNLSNSFFRAQDPDVIESLSAEILQILRDLIEDHKRNPRDDLVDHFLTVKIGERKLDDSEVLSMCFSLFLGGMDTVTNTLGFTFQYLAQDKALQVRLAADPGLIPKFVEEALRCFAVVNTPRLVIKDCEYIGVRMKAGEMVLNLLPMAGRDERKNDNPANFDIDRPKVSHLAFSTGPHICVGHLLARTEMQVIVEEWVKRIPSFRLKDGGQRRFAMGVVFALDSLPLEWRAPQ